MSIDPKIRDLVACMNSKGFKTYASCQGHGLPVRDQLPYVAFLCQLSAAQSLARVVRHDAEATEPRLYWGWEVTAGFNASFELCYRLSPTNPHHYIYQYWRGSLDHDFRYLRHVLKGTFH
ncbi:hypothetical protein KIF75_24285 [Serratia ureilytica]|uniref:hypothetical protein n=1 Tax=Serratia ureilytica TaxID=300181 RepID=UPI001BCEBC4B|nr:hypothetical protein [Serratia ureilytica]MBS7522804.1 hypothetical protein [Serratia ureilytica]